MNRKRKFMSRKYHDTNNATKEELLEDISFIERRWFEHNIPIEGTYCNRCSKYTIQEWHEYVNENLNLKRNYWKESYRELASRKIELIKELHKVLVEEYTNY
jgi:hypothetical protein